jgi:hypothetical protein
MYLDNSLNYDYLRREGRYATWQEQKQSRKKLQRFIHKQMEYKKVFDDILRYYKQFKGCLEQLEEFWIFLQESIYGTY